ncbi:hypothetical protein FYJ73_06490 [Prevotellaceae bacterium LKV-178-WT-2A]|uniref:Uncharacterized protein n=1 Tax=Hallella mizrahii TaxID=2606637 RepID=A0A7K0KEF3_9BACT|nr:hypothetical protein [Hallella mizrahii]
MRFRTASCLLCAASCLLCAASCLLCAASCLLCVASCLCVQPLGLPLLCSGPVLALPQPSSCLAAVFLLSFILHHLSLSIEHSSFRHILWPRTMVSEAQQIGAVLYRAA